MGDIVSESDVRLGAKTGGVRSFTGWTNFRSPDLQHRSTAGIDINVEHCSLPNTTSENQSSVYYDDWELTDQQVHIGSVRKRKVKRRKQVSAEWVNSPRSYQQTQHNTVMSDRHAPQQSVQNPPTHHAERNTENGNTTTLRTHRNLSLLVLYNTVTEQYHNTDCYSQVQGKRCFNVGVIKRSEWQW